MQDRRFAKAKQATRFPVSLKGQQCWLIELHDAQKGWKVVDSSENVVMWSNEQSLILVEDNQIKTFNGSVKFQINDDFVAFKLRCEGGLIEAY